MASFSAHSKKYGPAIFRKAVFYPFVTSFLPGNRLLLLPSVEDGDKIATAMSAEIRVIYNARLSAAAAAEGFFSCIACGGVRLQKKRAGKQQLLPPSIFSGSHALVISQI